MLHLVSFNLVPRSLVDEAEGEICKVRKFVFLDWLLHLTPVQSPLWKLTRFSVANFLQPQVLNLEISPVGENEKLIRKDERRKDLEVICHSGLSNFCNMIVPLPKSQKRHPARAQAPFYLPQVLYKPLPLFAFFALTRSPNLRTKTACQELIPEAF